MSGDYTQRTSKALAGMYDSLLVPWSNIKRCLICISCCYLW